MFKKLKELLFGKPIVFNDQITDAVTAVPPVVPAAQPHLEVVSSNKPAKVPKVTKVAKPATQGKGVNTANKPAQVAKVKSTTPKTPKKK